LLVDLSRDVVAQHNEKQKYECLVQLQQQVRPPQTRRVVIHIVLVDGDCTDDLNHHEDQQHNQDERIGDLGPLLLVFEDSRWTFEEIHGHKEENDAPYKLFKCLHEDAGWRRRFDKCKVDKHDHTEHQHAYQRNIFKAILLEAFNLHFEPKHQPYRQNVHPASNHKEDITLRNDKLKQVWLLSYSLQM
jgi:hypothetical protein